MPIHAIFDCAISSDLPLPELSAPVVREPIVLQLTESREEAAADEWTHQFRFPDGQLFFSVLNQDRLHLLDFPGTARFSIDLDGGLVGYHRSPSTTDETLRHLLVDQVLPRAIGHERALPILHASAVVTPGGLLAFVGDSGAGKSTLAASFTFEEGFPVSDDCLLIHQGDPSLRGIPSYFGVRLLPDSMSALGHRQAGQASVDWKHRWIPGTQHVPTAGNGGWPLAACFVLRPPPTNDESFTVRRLSPSEALVTLIGNSFALDLGDRRAHAGKLSVLSRLASEVPCHELSFSRDYARLPEVKRRILNLASSLR